MGNGPLGATRLAHVKNRSVRRINQSIDVESKVMAGLREELHMQPSGHDRQKTGRLRVQSLEGAFVNEDELLPGLREGPPL
jgi:hypothetical protein